MGQKSWPEERKEISLWLSGYLSMFNNWVEKILDDDEVSPDEIDSLKGGYVESAQSETRAVHEALSSS